MESSPPMRPAPSSPVASQYSMDLDALEIESVSDLHAPKPKVERIFSEDIDGPSDFTQNMEMWMRDGRTPKGTLGGRDSVRRPLHKLHEEEEQDEGEANQQHDLYKNDHDAAEYHDKPEAGYSRQANLDDTQHEDQFSSEWHTYDSASTPAPPAHRQLLQPSVEEYYSELSPMRPNPVQAVHKHSPPTFLSSGAQPSKGRHLTPGRASSPTLSPSRSPVTHPTTPSRNIDRDNTHTTIEVELEELRARCQQLQYLNDAMSRALEEEQRMRKQEIKAHTPQTLDTSAIMDNEVSAHRNSGRHEVGRPNYNAQDDTRPPEVADVGSSLPEQDSHDEVRFLKERLHSQSLDHQRELETLQQDLEIERQSRSSAEAAAQRHRTEAEEQQHADEANIARLEMEVQQARLQEHAVADVERRLEDAKAEGRQLKVETSELESSLKELREQLARTKQTHSQEISRVTTDRSRAIDMASSLQRQVRDLREQLKDQKATHESALEQLRAEQTKGSRVAGQELDVMRAESESKQNELNEAILERDEAQDALELAKTNEEGLRAEVADMKVINAELDVKIFEKLQKRESYWKEKLEESEKERQLMAKVLLHQWGREEVGTDSPQRYAYQYSSKSPVKSPVESVA